MSAVLNFLKSSYFAYGIYKGESQKELNTELDYDFFVM